MKEQSWMPGDVYFGDPDAEPADWRKEESESDRDDDAEPSEAERRAVVGMLGFDPREHTEDHAEAEPFHGDYETSWGHKLREQYPDEA